MEKDEIKKTDMIETQQLTDLIKSLENNSRQKDALLDQMERMIPQIQRYAELGLVHAHARASDWLKRQAEQKISESNNKRINHELSAISVDDRELPNILKNGWLKVHTHDCEFMQRRIDNIRQFALEEKKDKDLATAFAAALTDAGFVDVTEKTWKAVDKIMEVVKKDREKSFDKTTEIER